jgi:hypothetical protein
MKKQDMICFFKGHDMEEHFNIIGKGQYGHCRRCGKKLWINKYWNILKPHSISEYVYNVAKEEK